MGPWLAFCLVQELLLGWEAVPQNRDTAQRLSLLQEMSLKAAT